MKYGRKIIKGNKLLIHLPVISSSRQLRCEMINILLGFQLLAIIDVNNLEMATLLLWFGVNN